MYVTFLAVTGVIIYRESVNNLLIDGEFVLLDSGCHGKVCLQYRECIHGSKNLYMYTRARHEIITG